MTDAEIEGVLGSQVTRLPKPESYSGLHVDLVISSINVAADRFRVSFQMGDESHRLRQVIFHLLAEHKNMPNEVTFHSLERSLTQKYGQPTLRSGELPEDAAVLWVFPSTTIELHHLFIPQVLSSLTITYRPTASSTTTNI